MDIAKFNEVLAAKIARAKIFEKHNDLEAAIKQWIEISEMTLGFLKTVADISYRNMLITKTKQIVEHIKNLKYGPKKEEVIIEKIIPQEEIPPEQESSVLIPEETSIPQEIEINVPKTNASNRDDLNGLNNIKIIEDSDIKNLPSGIKEIEPPEEFKIITPHDENYVEKMRKLSEKINTDIFKNQEKTPNQDSNKNNVRNKVICFACGAELLPNTKICKKCGTKLD